MQTSIKKTKH